ncbi:hypothetical protein APA_3345 [Pseudanabaena sp. lw0831]|nr:hypothetical protein APA_3345 [Pseudanabaena sp. lw0831]
MFALDRVSIFESLTKQSFKKISGFLYQVKYERYRYSALR